MTENERSAVAEATDNYCQHKSKARNNLTSGNAVGIPNSFLYITLTNIFFFGGEAGQDLGACAPWPQCSTATALTDTDDSLISPIVMPCRASQPKDVTHSVTKTNIHRNVEEFLVY